MSNHTRDEIKIMLEKVELVERRFGKNSKERFKAVREFQRVLGLALHLQEV
jgi:hypothetical protein